MGFIWLYSGHMSFQTDGYPRTASVSPSLQVVESTDSTNAHLLRLAAEAPETHPHLSVLLTRNQRGGRGRLGRTWTTPPNSAVAVSVILHIAAVATADRGWVPLVAGAAMTRAVAALAPEHVVELKWPNDVLVDGKKISGILTEVSPTNPQTVVVGAGVNTAMTTDELPVPSATSFAVLGIDVDEDLLLARYMVGLRDGIAQLAVEGGAHLRGEIEQLCATVGKDVAVSLPDDSILRGRATGLDEQGRLVVSTGAASQAVSAGDVIHVR